MQQDIRQFLAIFRTKSNPQTISALIFFPYFLKYYVLSCDKMLNRMIYQTDRRKIKYFVLFGD